MSKDSKACSECGKKPKSLKIEVGKYGAILTIAVLVCQLIDNVFV